MLDERNTYDPIPAIIARLERSRTRQLEALKQTEAHLRLLKEPQEKKEAPTKK